MGRKIDYLSPTFYFTDIILGFLAVSITRQFLTSYQAYSVILSETKNLLEILRLKRRPQDDEKHTGSIKSKLYIKKTLLNKEVIIVFTFLVIISWVTLSSWHSGMGVYFILRFIELVFVVWAIFVIKPTLWEIAWPLGISVIFSSLLAIAQFLMQHSLGGAFYFLGERTFSAQTVGIAQAIIDGRTFLRPYATFPHPNVLGGFLTTLLPLWLHITTKDDKRKFVFKTSVIILTFIGVFISFSRIAWVGTLFCLIYFIHKPRLYSSSEGVRTTESRSFRRLVLDCARTIMKRRSFYILLGLIIILIIEELTVARLSNLLMVDTESVVERQKLAQSAFAMISHSPFFGVGPGRFIPMIPIVSSPPYLLQPVHSIYLLLVAETGVIGLGLFLWILVKAMILAKKNRQTYLFMSLGVISFLGLFDHYFVTLEQTRLLFVLIATLALMKPVLISKDKSFVETGPA